MLHISWHDKNQIEQNWICGQMDGYLVRYSSELVLFYLCRAKTSRTVEVMELIRPKESPKGKLEQELVIKARSIKNRGLSTNPRQAGMGNQPVHSVLFLRISEVVVPETTTSCHLLMRGWVS